MMNKKIVITPIVAFISVLVIFTTLFFVVNSNPILETEDKSNEVKHFNSKIEKLIDNPYPDFHGVDEKGNEVSIKDIVGNKPAVIIFFALGDKPGTFDFLPNLNPLYDKYGNRVEFVAVLLSRSNSEEVQELKRMLPLKIPVLLGYSDAIRNYEIAKVDVPYIVIINREGVVKHIILRPESEMIEEAPYKNHNGFSNKTEKERIKSSVKIIDGYIKDLL